MSALVTANGLAVLNATVCLPRTGVWHADLKIDSSEDMTGPVLISISDGQLTLQGTVFRGGNFIDTEFVRVVGGAGGLRRPAKARQYIDPHLRIVLQDLLATAGERLSSTVDPTVLSKSLPAWTTSAISVGRMLTRVIEVAAPGASWRILPDGTFWVGFEAWPDSGLTPDDYETLDEEPQRAEAFLGVEAPLLLPGTTLGERRVSYVEHTVNGDGVRSTVAFEGPGAGGQDRLRAALAGAVAGALAPIDYFALVRAKVVAQSPDLATIDVEPDNPPPPAAPRWPSMGSVPLALPWGFRVQIDIPPPGQPPTYCLVGWAGGDPSQPYALPYPLGDGATKVFIDAGQIVIGDIAGAEPAVKGTTLQNYLNSAAATIAAHAHPAPGGATSPSPTLASLQPVPVITTRTTQVE